jgi:hypothetical protein
VKRVDFDREKRKKSAALLEQEMSHCRVLGEDIWPVESIFGAENALGGLVLLSNFLSETLSLNRMSKICRYDNHGSRRKSLGE